ncbi:heat shock protein 20, putative [Trypanosoma equiperdum]|uniref:Heat shock protein 20, putative n=4 Tax=Trypanozoon TaxID=39700 RepID=Q57V53_TRYB2|nr:heat shock protein 20, putative [Trypanosoma brucei gambiense DAL972]XP_843926.1 heat shock protein 20, putative [Trypanosoma brucei brucei TREU927]AAX70515.1 heat shock protein 20, putative [Trypanosoma brucei]RHW73539.1 heat shock protein 20 [Trypanosoma brucei equiperdum]SCU65590.1 heat shock protein 20, putative [Trypanosoma equiperdum]AAZ10367.1 heat shock protein 20, putative [Trypanosoma brucei brucei TREU927]CBH10010.1 heat shock protein 20, putative [Trypanosoma brucei gambiense D|eukprot:XP_011772301.1 heat shock protein 20, putative [Trypanosoma brucei gambiense DAL972]
MWDPFRDIDRIFNRVLPLTGAGSFSSFSRGSWSPAMDLVEKPEGYKLLVDLPGMNREDIQVGIEDNRLCISGNRKSLLKDDEQHLAVFLERGYGRFERCMNLPSPIVEESVKARLRDSVLVVELKKNNSPASSAATSVTIQ